MVLELLAKQYRINRLCGFDSHLRCLMEEWWNNMHVGQTSTSVSQ